MDPVSNKPPKCRISVEWPGSENQRQRDKENRFVPAKEGRIWKALAEGTCSLSLRNTAELG